MASSKFSSSLSLFLSLNLLFFSLASGCGNSCPNPTPNNPSPKPTPENPSPKPTPNNPSTGHHQKRCPRDALKLGVCADVLKLVHVVVGTPPKLPCCTLLEGLVELEAALCLCTAIKANVLGINLNIPLSLSLLLNYCGKNVPTGFQCA